LRRQDVADERTVPHQRRRLDFDTDEGTRGHLLF
jgi:hypothetical protein